MTAFFLSSLEAFYLGGLKLTIINVPSDGNFMLFFVALAGVFSGSNIWFEWDVPFTYGLLNWGQLWIVFCPMIGLSTCIWNIFQMCKYTTVQDLFKKLFGAIILNLTFLVAFFFNGQESYLKQNYIWFLYIFV